MAADQGSTLFESLISRGLSPIHAAALAGNMQRESSFDPSAVNPKEDAHGLIQWRNDRWQALQDFAKQRGTEPTDRETQLDFIGHEMGGSERKAGSRFMAATDLPGANDALKSYIRYGDDSAATRLANASRILGAPIAEGGAPVPPSPQPVATPSPPAQTGMLSGMPGLEPGGAAAPAASPAPPGAGPSSAPAPMAAQAASDPMAQLATPQPLNMPLTAQAKARLFAALSTPRQ